MNAGQKLLVAKLIGMSAVIWGWLNAGMHAHSLQVRCRLAAHAPPGFLYTLQLTCIHLTGGGNMGPKRWYAGVYPLLMNA